MKKEFLRKAIQFLNKHEVEILETSEEGPLTVLWQAKLENLPRRPHLLIRWKGELVLVFISDKDELFHSRDGTNKTGGDWPTFQFFYYIERETKIDVALLIHEKETDTWYFRQLNQLPRPEIGWRDRCLASEYKRENRFNCALCWKDNITTCHRCMKKKQPTALWSAEEFANKILIQTKLL